MLFEGSLLNPLPAHHYDNDRNIGYGKQGADYNDRGNQRTFCLLQLGTNTGQLFFRSGQPVIERVYCSLKCGLSLGNLSFQRCYCASVYCFKRRLGRALL